MPNPDPLHVVRDDERLLIRVGGELLDERAYRIGLVDGAASHPLWRRIIAAIVGAFIAGLLIGRLIVPVSAAPRPAQPVIPGAAIEAGATGNLAGQIGASLQDRDPARSGEYASGAPTSDVGTALASGIVAYAAPALGDRYLALPGGAGALVRICARSGTVCLDRVSTDAGPALSMQRAGRIADVSFVDFAWLCRCDPPDVGLLVATIEWIGPELTPPATETEP
jgi:hypothetical protein